LRQRENVNLSIYARGLAVLVKNPAIVVFPLLAAVLEMAMQWIRGPLFDPLGGNDFGFFSLIINLIDGFAFSLAIIAAETGWRGRKATFTATMDEGGRKAANILLATIGFFFVLFAAGLVASYLPIPFLGLLLTAAAAYFLIYVFPAAAIGGIPGFAAISASIERVRSNYLGAAVLAIVAIVLFYYVVGTLGVYLTLPLGLYAPYGVLLIKAIVLAYLAVVFARQYDEVA
jgi:hypothetical protein